MIRSVKVLLDQIEYSTLIRLADKELRNPENQIRFLIREAAQKHGVVMGDPLQPAAAGATTNDKKSQ